MNKHQVNTLIEALTEKIDQLKLEVEVLEGERFDSLDFVAECKAELQTDKTLGIRVLEDENNGLNELCDIRLKNIRSLEQTLKDYREKYDAIIKLAESRMNEIERLEAENDRLLSILDDYCIQS